MNRQAIGIIALAIACLAGCDSSPCIAEEHIGKEYIDKAIVVKDYLFNLSSLKVGDVALLPRVRVLQKLNSDEMLATVHGRYGRARDDIVIHLSECPTEGLFEGTSYRLMSEKQEYVGLYHYENSLGHKKFVPSFCRPGIIPSLATWRDTLKIGSVGTITRSASFISFREEDDGYTVLASKAFSRVHRLILAGFDGSKMSLGDRIPYDSVFEIAAVVENEGEELTDLAGKYTYLLKPVTRFKKPSPKRNPVPYLRTWTNDVHGSTVHAAFYDYSGSTVSLMTESYQVVDIPLKMLSREDQGHVRKLLRERKADSKK
ncbi:MAG: hypothetical protein AAGJ40_09370 [Planctomycetota bacterium]